MCHYKFTRDERKETRWRSLLHTRRRRRLCGAEEMDGAVDMPKVDGVAPRNQTGVRGQHCEVRQRASVDEFARVMERPASNEGRFTG